MTKKSKATKKEVARDEDVAEPGTKHVRMNSDLVEMIAGIVKVKKMRDGTATSAKFLDPIIRPDIVTTYEKYKPAIEAMKKGQAASLNLVPDDEE